MTQPATPQAPERAALEKLMQHLWQDAAAGDLDTSRNRLTLQPPWRARQAVMHLGLPYLQKIKSLGDRAHLGALSGPAAVNAYIDDTLKPIVASKPRPPAPMVRQPRSPAVKKYKTGKLRRFVSRIALAGALGLCVVTGGQWAIDAMTPDPIVTPAIGSITELRDEFSRTVMGRELLAMADRGGVTVVYDPTLGARGNNAEYNAATKQASVRPDLSPDDQVLYLSHELRHAWQDLELGYDAMEERLLTPVQRWVVRRFLEADAAAFSTVFLAERMQAMYHTEQPQGSGAYFEYTLAKALLREYRSGDGLTPAEYREQVLTSAFANLGSYDDKHIALAILPTQNMGAELRIAQFYVDNNLFDAADAALDRLKDMIATTPDDREFEEWLRRMGGIRLQAAVKTALQDTNVSREDMFNRYAGLGTLSGNTAARPGAAVEKMSRLHVANTLHQAQVDMVMHLERLNALKKEAYKPPQTAQSTRPQSRIVL